MKDNKKYYYLYKITNNINKKYYYGIHGTNNLNDGYMGSGKILKVAYKKYGIDNFTKTIIKFCNSLKEVSDLEKQLVNDILINDDNCYNITLGGYYLDDETLQKIGKLNKINQSGNNNSRFNTCWVYKDNESKSILKDELHIYLKNGWIKGRKIKNIENIQKANKNRCWVHKGNIIHFIQKENLDTYIKNGFTQGKQDKPIKHKKPIKGSMLNKVRVQDIYGNRYTVSKDDERYISGELFSILKGKPVNKNFTQKGKVIVKDNFGNIFCVDKNDPRYLSGELVGVNKGKHWKQNKHKKENLKPIED